MSVVAKLLDRMKSKKADQAASTFEAYHEMLIELASDRDFEPEKAESILEQVGKTNDDVETDVAVLRDRIVCAAKLAARPSHVEAMAAAQKASEAAQSALAAAYAKWNPIIADAYAKVQAAAIATNLCDNAESRLYSTVFDPTILQPEHELLVRRKVLLDEHSELNNFINRNDALAQTYENSVVALSAKFKAAFNYDKPTRESFQRKIVEQKALASKFKAQADSWRGRLQSLDHELRPIAIELERLRIRKLIP